MQTTFWKPELPLTDDPLANVKLAPLGAATSVVQTLGTIPNMYVQPAVIRGGGYVSLLWLIEQGLALSFRDEPEFGRGGVFSIIVDGRDRVGRKTFLRLYVQMYERLGVTLCEEGRFIDVRAYRKA